MRYLLLALFLVFSSTHPVLADCTSPAGAESQTRYDFTAHKLYYCNGTNWVESGGASGGGGATQQTTQSCNINKAVISGINRVAYECTTADCLAGYVRSGCSASGVESARAEPSGTSACYCRSSATENSGKCYTYCVK